MPQPRSIKDYFKRPTFVTDAKNPLATSAEKPRAQDIQTFPAASQPSSPLSDPPSDLPPRLPSAQHLPDDGSTRKLALGGSVLDHHEASGAALVPSSSFGGSSLTSSQRVVKNGIEVVVDSDAESGDSIGSVVSSEELLNRFLGSSVDKAKDSASLPGPRSSKFRYSQNNRVAVPLKPKKYKFSMESLVTRSVDHSETEAGVAKAKAQLERREQHEPGNEADTATGIREDVLASAFAAEKEETDLQRLLDAVRRTEAFDVEKSWCFFGNIPSIQIPEFPRDSILPSSRESFLREPASRERAFHSGVLDFALTRGLLPDEVIMWTFQSVPLEPRDDLRYAYCRALKCVPGQRIESLIQPSDIELVFGSLGGTQTALNTYEEITLQNAHDPEKKPGEWKCLLSVLELLGDLADNYNKDTRQYTLQILFRLALDTYIVKTATVCSTLETTIDSVLQSIPDDSFDEAVQPIAKSAFQTIRNITLQSQLLKHLLPTNRDIALLRIRLAVSFLIDDDSVLLEPAEDVLDLNRITQYLRRNSRFGSKLLGAKSSNNYDYSELKAATTLLNIAINRDRILPGKEAESQFNMEVDALADRVKRIFSAIEDSGASHLKRTEAKQSLEALHYRIVFSVRSKPRARTVFGIDESQTTITETMPKGGIRAKTNLQPRFGS